MDYRTYQQIRTYCCHDLSAFLDLPGYDDVRKMWGKLNGQVGLIQREQQCAHSLHQCSDLTPRERAAAELLAVISNHWAIAWQGSTEPPNGNKPEPPLTKVEADALATQTLNAVKRYAAFLPEREAAILLRDCETALDDTPAAAKGKAGTTTPGDDWTDEARVIAEECFEADTKAGVRDSLATKNSVGHITGGYCFRVMGIMQERGIKGPRGIIGNPATIMREALQGKKWWANKQK